MKSSFRSDRLFPSCSIEKQPDICEVWFMSVLKEQRRQNYPFDVLTASEGCIFVLLAEVVLSDFVQPSILCDPGYVITILGNKESNMKQVFLPKRRLYSLWDKTINGIKNLFFFSFSLLFHKILYLILLTYNSKNTIHRYLIFYYRFEVCLQY